MLERLEGASRAGYDAAGRWLTRFWGRRGPFVLFCSVLGVLAYGVEIFNVSLSIDEEMHAFHETPTRNWLVQDRPGMYLLNRAFTSGPSLPFLPPLIAIAASTATALLLAGLWREDEGPGLYLMAPFVLLLPTNAFLYQFNTAQYGFYLALLLGVASVSLFVAGGRWRIALATLLLTFALSVYQPIGAAVLTAYLFHRLNHDVLDPGAPGGGARSLRRLAGAGAWLAGCLVLHKLVATGVRAVLDMRLGYAAVDRYYSPAIFERYQLEQVAAFLSDFLLGGRPYLGPQVGSVFLLCFATALVLVFLRRRDPASRVVGVLLLGMATLAPFLLVVATGRSQPARSLIGLPVMFGGLVFSAFRVRSYAVKWVLIAAVAVSTCGFIVSNNRLFYADQVRWMNDRALAYRLIDRIEALSAVDPAADVPERGLVVVGMHRFPATLPMPRDETFGASLFEWDQGNSRRIVRLLWFLGADHLRSPTDAMLARGLDEGRSMAVWPAPDSVRLSGDIVIVKLGPPTPFQLGRRRAYGNR